MKKYLISSMLLFIVILSPAMANSFSLDLEKDSSQYASLADANQTNLDLNTVTYFTIEFWIKPETDTTSGEIITKRNNNVSNGWEIAYASGSLTAYYWQNNSTFSYLGQAGIVSTGSWQHFSIVFNVATPNIDFYKNGAFVSGGIVDSYATSIQDTTASVAVGARYNTGTAERFYDGLIDEIRIWSDERTSTEIADYYDVDLVGDETNLELYLKFEDNFLDETVNNNDFTNNNSASFSVDAPSLSVPPEPEPEPATTTVDYYPCEIPENTLIQRKTGCLNIYRTSTTTPDEIQFYYEDDPMILYIFIFSLGLISIFVIFIYIIINKKK